MTQLTLPTYHFPTEPQWLTTSREQAKNSFEFSGFPTRHDEEWKYTPLNTRGLENYSPETAGHYDPQSISQHFVPDAIHLILHNGALANKPALPEGIRIVDLPSALALPGDPLKEYCNILDTSNPILSLNRTVLNGGYYLQVDANIELTQPLQILIINSGEHRANHALFVIDIAENSKIEILEHYIGMAADNYLQTAYGLVKMATHAKLTHRKIIQESPNATHLSFLHISQEPKSEVCAEVYTFSGALVRADTHVDLQTQSSCELNGLFLGKNKQHIDHHTTIHHRAAEASSRQLYKGILNHDSRGVFNGKVIVAPHAIQTRAEQSNKNLLLSKTAEMNTKPQLEIFADDVRCTHGATVGQLDEDALFYLASRGLPPQEAQQLLVDAFAKDILNSVKSQPIRDFLHSLLHQHHEGTACSI